MTSIDAGAVAEGEAAAAPVLSVIAYGKCITQGSKTKGRYGNIRDSNADLLKPWRDNVRSAALEAMKPEHPDGFGTVPVIVHILFFMARPNLHFRTGRYAHLLRDAAPPYPTGKNAGDIDKLQRACFDSLTDAGVWKDDSQIVYVIAKKAWCNDAFRKPGVQILVLGAMS